MNILWTEKRTFRYPFPLLLAAFSSFFPLAISAFSHFLLHTAFATTFSFSLLISQYFSIRFFFCFSWAFSGVSHILHLTIQSFPFFSCSSSLPLSAHPFFASPPSIPPANLFLSPAPFSQPTTYPPNQQLSFCSSFRNWALYPSFRQAPLLDLHPAFASPLHL